MIAEPTNFEEWIRREEGSRVSVIPLFAFLKEFTFFFPLLFFLPPRLIFNSLFAIHYVFPKRSFERRGSNFNPFSSSSSSPLGEDLLKLRDFESRLRKSASTFELVFLPTNSSLSLASTLAVLRSRKFETRVMTSNAEDKRNREREGRKGERATLHKRREGEEETTTRGEAGVGFGWQPDAESAH